MTTVSQHDHDDLTEFAHAEQHRANAAESALKKLREEVREVEGQLGHVILMCSDAETNSRIEDLRWHLQAAIRRG